MFGIGSTELLVIFVVALIVLGPKSIPQLAKTLGKVMGEFKRVSTDFQRSMNAEVEMEEHEKRKKEAEQELFGDKDKAAAPTAAQPAPPAASAQAAPPGPAAVPADGSGAAPAHHVQAAQIPPTEPTAAAQTVDISAPTASSPVADSMGSIAPDSPLAQAVAKAEAEAAARDAAAPAPAAATATATGTPTAASPTPAPAEASTGGSRA